MTGKTHLAAGIVTSLLIGANAPQIALIAIGSMLPDIDHSGSTFGRKIKPISRRIEHRGVTHSLLFLLAMTVISPYIGIGILTHIVLDLFNPNGVKLLYPLKIKVKVPIISHFIKTGGVMEHIILFLIISVGILSVIFYDNIWGGFDNILKFTTLWFK